MYIGQFIVDWFIFSPLNGRFLGITRTLHYVFDSKHIIFKSQNYDDLGAVRGHKQFSWRLNNQLEEIRCFFLLLVYCWMKYKAS